MPATRPAIRIERLVFSPGPVSSASRDGNVDTLRGLACLLLVAFHAVGSSSASGLQVPDGSPYREFTNLFVHVRMPLFTFLSGLVYAFRPLSPGEALRFSGKKLRRLGVPLVVASTILYGLHLAVHDPVPPLSRMWSVYVSPFYHLWFVQALLPVFAVLVILESFGAVATLRRFLLVLTLSLGLYWCGPLVAPDAFGLRNATYLLPFFLWGLGVHRFRPALQSQSALFAAAACFVVTQGLHSYMVLTRVLAPIEPVAARSAWTLLIGMSAGLCSLRLLGRVPLMERIGTSSYAIYLYHPLFVAVALAGIGAIHVFPTSLLFAMAAAAGLAGPMVMEVLAARVPLGGLLLEGRVRQSPPATVEAGDRRERALRVA
ncbi:MAG TPA: acyltransferase [Gemmatimonadales bacterium]|jgi:peptidoglycan/LPS O-acetylase OafA/YrhL